MNLEELALLLGLSNEELIAKAEELNIDLSSISEELDEELVAQLKDRLNIGLPDVGEDVASMSDAPEVNQEEELIDQPLEENNPDISSSDEVLLSATSNVEEEAVPEKDVLNQDQGNAGDELPPLSGEESIPSNLFGKEEYANGSETSLSESPEITAEAFPEAPTERNDAGLSLGEEDIVQSEIPPVDEVLEPPLEEPTETFEVPIDETTVSQSAMSEIPLESIPHERELTSAEVDAIASEVSEEERRALGGTPAAESADDVPSALFAPEKASAETPVKEPAKNKEKKKKDVKEKKEKKAKNGDIKEKGNPLQGILTVFSDFFIPIFTTPVHRNILILGTLFSAIVALTFSSLLTPSVTVQPELTPEQIEEAKKKELPPVQIRGGFRGEKDLFQLIWELHLQGYYEQAYDYAQRFVEEHRDSDLIVDVYYKMADILYDWNRGSITQQYKEARGAYEKAIAYMPDNPKVPWGEFQIANTYFFLNVFDAAIDYYRALVKNYPTYEYLDIAQSRLALSFLKSHQYERAELEYKRLLELYPESSLIRNAHFKMAEIYYRQKDLKKSIAAYKKYLEQYPHTPKRVEVYFRIAKLYKYLKNYDQAIAYFEKSVDKYPNDMYSELATFEIAENWLLLKNFDKAREYYTKVIELYPKHPLAQTAYHRIGDAYLKEGKETEAIDVYEKALTSFPDLQASRLSEVKLADLYFQRGDYDQAISIFSDILVNDPNYYANDRVVFRIAQANYRKGNYLEATDWYLRLIREYPASLLVKKAYFDKAQAEFASNFYERAVTSYLEFIKRFPDHPHVDLISYMVGDMYYRLGKFMQAVGYWEDMRANYPLSDYRYKALNDIGKTYLKMASTPEYFSTLRDEYSVKGTDEDIANGLQLKAQETFLQIVGNKALEGTDEFFEAGKELSHFYYADKEYDKALKQINSLLGLYSAHRDIYTLMNLKARLNYDLNLFDETVSAYEDLISLLTFRLNKNTEALTNEEKESYQIVIAEAYFSLGDLFFSQDKTSESLYLYLEGLKKLPEGHKRGWPLYQVANCYNSLNNYNKANYYYDQLKKDFPDDYWSEYVGWNKERIKWKQDMEQKGVVKK
jgi:TolA-binding protein